MVSGLVASAAARICWPGLRDSQSGQAARRTRISSSARWLANLSAAWRRRWRDNVGPDARLAQDDGGDGVAFLEQAEGERPG
jgi:hypothetical protein